MELLRYSADTVPVRLITAPPTSNRGRRQMAVLPSIRQSASGRFMLTWGFSTPSGISSVTTRFCAAEGPLFRSATFQAISSPTSTAPCTGALVNSTSALVSTATSALARAPSSAVGDVAVASLTSTPGSCVESTRAHTLRSACSPTPRSPTRQVTVRAAASTSQPGASNRSKPSGIRSVTTTSVAGDGPSLTTLRKNVVPSPAARVESAAIFESRKDACCSIGTTTVSWSLLGSGSGVAVVTLTVLLTDSPWMSGDTLMKMTCSPPPPGATVACRHVTVCPSISHSPEPCTDCGINPGGSSSVTTTSRAVEGPALLTVSL